MFKIQSRTVNAAGTRRAWKDLRHAPRFTTEAAAQEYIARICNHSPEDMDLDDFRVKPPDDAVTALMDADWKLPT